MQNQSKIYAKKGKTNIFFVLIFSVFAIMGAVFLYFMFLTPIIKITKAKKWVEVSCVISKSQVVSHSGDGSTTYLVDINFTYQYNGKRYEGGQYNFNNSSSSGFQSKNEVVLQYPVGFQTKCFVDPKNPIEAVLNREYYNLNSAVVMVISVVFSLVSDFYPCFF